MIIGSKIIFHEKLVSTNLLAADMLKTENLPEGTIVRAGFQTGGRGQIGAEWESEESRNLLISAILYPGKIKIAEQFLISMAISLGVFDFISRHSARCKIKWPNDIYVFDEKISGILIENSVMNSSILNCIAGIGVNINQVTFTSDAPNPVSLKLIANTDFKIDKCLNELCLSLDKRYKSLISESYDEIIDDYNRNLYRKNEWHSFSDSQGEFEGKILSVSRFGIMTIETKNSKQKEYSFKEIDFIF